MRRLAIRLGVLSAVVLLTVGTAELLLRLFLPLRLVGDPRAYQYDEDLGYRLKPGMHYLNTTDFQAEMRTNAIGSVNFQESFDHYETLVFALGDSFTQGTGLRPDATYPFQLDLFLNVDSGGYHPRFGIVNLGLAAFGMEQSMLALQRWRKAVGTPRYILFFGCGNDYDDDQLFMSGYRHGHIVAGSPTYGVWVAPLQWLMLDFELGKRLKIGMSKLRRLASASRTAKSAGGGASGAQAVDPFKDNVAELEAARFDRLLQMSREMGAELIVSWTGWHGTQGDSYSWLRSWAKDRGVRFADWQPRVLSMKEAIPTLHFDNPHSGGHYQTWVNRLIADTYGEQILAAQDVQAARAGSGKMTGAQSSIGRAD
jgi:hypothetical protein